MSACDSATTTPGTPTVAATETPTTAAPTAGPTTAASPSPVDVGSAFEAQIAAANKGSLQVTGSLQEGSQRSSVTGTLTYAGADTSAVLTIDGGGAASMTSTIRSKGLGYTKLADGPWLKDVAPPLVGSDLWSFLRGLVGVADRGVEQHEGVAAHRIDPPAGVAFPAAALGLGDRSILGAATTATLYAGDDGRPLAIAVTVSWVHSVAGVATPATLTIDLAYRQIGGDLAVAAPDHVWNRFRSSRYHFSIGYPGTWAIDTGQPRDDYLNGPGVTHVGGRRLAAKGQSLGQWTKNILGVHNSARLDYTLLSNVAATLDGAPARMLTSTYRDYGQRLVCYELIALHGGYLYDVFWVSPVKTGTADLKTYRKMLATYAFS